jgi:hypothetical protein
MSGQQGMVAGWLGPILRRIETTHTPRPSGGNVVSIPQGLDKLRDAILHVQNEREQAIGERTAIDEASDAVQNELRAAYERNAVRQRDIATRLFHLQGEWSRASAALGMRCEVDHPPQAVFSGGEGEPE